MSEKLHLIKSSKDCVQCDIYSLCIAVGLDPGCTGQLSDIVKTVGPFKSAEHVYRTGDKFQSLYIVQTGVLKSQTTTPQGRHLVTGFYFPGDLVGLDGISSKTYPCYVTALERSWLCEVEFEELENLCRDQIGVQHELFSRLSSRIYKNEHQHIVNRGESADKRLAEFLFEIYERLNNSNQKRNNFLHLPMTKADAASYLGLSAESVSRSLKRLEEKGIIRNSSKHIELLNLEAIKKYVSK